MFQGIPTEELLDSTHSFPCQYRFKVIGSSEDHFVGRVLTAVCKELGEGIEPPFSTRSTAGGRHVSVTVEPEMETASHVIAVYIQLQKLDGLVMLL